MARLLAAEVFTPTSYPTYTYVPRDEQHHERLLAQWKDQPTLVVAVSGPSKAGKTVLVQRAVGEGNLITVSGASVRVPDQLWERVLDWWGEPHSTTASHADAATTGKTVEHAANAGVGGVGASRRSSNAIGSGATENLSATVNRRGLPQVVAELGGTPFTVLLDDFHYIPAAIQSDIAQQLKDAASRGVRICVASVPHRADNVVRALPELRGRVLAIDLDYWTRRDLLEIPRVGCDLLGLTVDAPSLIALATEAAGSPQLMQWICLWMCNHLGVRETAEPPRTVTLDDAARRAILELTSCTVDFRTLVRALIAGPKARGADRKIYTHRDLGRGDVYLTTMRALAMDPPKLTLGKDELAERLAALCQDDPPDGASIVRTCSTLAQIAGGLAPPTGPSLEWDERDQELILSDPYLLFYLRWSRHLDKEADELSRDQKSALTPT